MKNILVPTDFSDCARLAENAAFEIAIKAGAEIHFLHIFDSPVDWVKLPLEKEQLYPETKLKFNNANRELNELVKKAEKLGLKAKEFLIFNEGRSAIDDHIKHHHHDFIVMGSHGTGGIKEIMGSNTQKVVRYSNAPVLVIKNGNSKCSFDSIVFASNFEDESINPFLRFIEFAKLFGAEIHLLFVNVPGRFMETDEIEAKVNGFLGKCPDISATVSIYDALNAERGIIKFADKISADLIVVATHGRSGLMRLISPSVTENLVNHSEEAVLCMNITD